MEKLPWQRVSVRKVVMASLAVQCFVGLAVISDDIWTVLARKGQTEIKTVPTIPVSPGDQTRPFTRVTIPASTDPRKRLDAPIRLPETLPLKLEFSVQEVEGVGIILLLAGEIADGDANRFRAFLESLPKPPDIVALHSPGGRVHEALDIGRIIRSAKLDTMISPDAACLSSCPYVLAGGVERQVSRNGWVGLHQHYYDTNVILPMFMAVSNIQFGQAATLAYLDEMGVDPMITVHAMETPPDDIYLLVEDELKEFRVATTVVG